MGIFDKMKDKEEVQDAGNIQTIAGLDVSLIKEELLRGARVFKAFEKGAEVAATLQNLQDAIGNTRARLDDILAKEQNALNSLEEAGLKVSAALVAAKDITDKAKVDAEAEKAAGINAIDDHKEALEMDLVELNRAIELGKDELETVTATLDERKKALEDINTEIERVKASIGAK